MNNYAREWIQIYEEIAHFIYFISNEFRQLAVIRYNDMLTFFLQYTNIIIHFEIWYYCQHYLCGPTGIIFPYTTVNIICIVRISMLISNAHSMCVE